MDLTEKSFGTFDVVLFLQVLYHLHSPFQALLNVRRVCTDMMILETMVADVPESCAMFYGTHRVNLYGKPTPYPNWRPSPLCVEEMLRDAGFSKFKRVWESEQVHEWPDSPHRRMAWHAWA